MTPSSESIRVVTQEAGPARRGRATAEARAFRRRLRETQRRRAAMKATLGPGPTDGLPFRPQGGYPDPARD